MSTPVPSARTFSRYNICSGNYRPCATATETLMYCVAGSMASLPTAGSSNEGLQEPQPTASDSEDIIARSIDLTHLTKVEVQSKLKSGEFVLVDKSKDGRARNEQLWRKFQSIVNKKDSKSTEFVCCCDCQEVFKHHSQKSGTTHLKTHLQSGCKVNKSAKHVSHTQTAITGFITNNTRQKHARSVARKRAVEMCAKDVRPFSILEGEGFRAFAQAMIDIGAQMGKVSAEDILPDRRTVSTDATALFQQKQQELAKTIQTHTSSGNMIGATTDLWTDDVKHQHYMSLTIHVEEDWTLMSRLVTLKHIPSNIKKTAVNLRSEIFNSFKDLHIEPETVKSRVVFTTDCGANVVKALSVCNWIGCGCHQLATVLRHVFVVTREEETYFNVLLNIEEVQQAEDDVVVVRGEDGVECEVEIIQIVNKQMEALSKVVAHLKRTGLNGELPNSVYQENKTRWNSRLNSMRSVIRQMDNIVSLLQRSDQSILVDDIDVDLLNTVCDFLKPFEDATKDMEADHVPTLHKAVLWYFELQKILSTPSSVQIRRSLNERALRFLRQKFVIGTFHKVAVFLCPMFRRLMMFPIDERSGVLAQVRQFINDFPDPTDTCQAPSNPRNTNCDHEYAPVAKRPYRFAAFEDDDTVESDDEVAQYLQTTFNFPPDESFNPLKFWSNSAQQFPKLAHVARSIFCCPAASSASERAFSNAGAVYSKRRGGTMSATTLEALCFLHSEGRCANDT